MIFESIEFFQYRCFMEGILTFDEKDEDGRSINLILAENGGGKTELLFAFSWALYDFDFSTLQNKEDTPYSLNSEIYRKLINNPKDSIDECWVKITFSHGGKTYTIKKMEYYEKVKGYSSLKRRVKAELVIKLENGVTNPPITDQKYINKTLNEVIPLKVLNGIIFDGERMQKLASSDERSVEGVKGVIFDVTNQEKLEYLLDIINSVENDINKRMSKAKRNASDRAIDTISNNIEILDAEIKNNENSLNNVTSELTVCESKLEDISTQLKKYDEIKELENRRIEAHNNLGRTKKSMEKAVSDFGIELNTNGPNLVYDKILDEAQETITSFDIPKGLNVEAVESILKKGECICGDELSDEKITILNSLIDLLPPDNLNSALLEQINSLRSNQEKARSKLKEYRSNIKHLDSEEAKYKEDLIHYKSLISLSGIGDSKKLEDQRGTLLYKQAGLKRQESELPDEIAADKIKVNGLRDQKTLLLKMAELSDKLAEKWIFISKAKKATERLRDELQNIALQKINELIKKSYKEITESSEIGRDVHLIHNINTPGTKYRVVNFYAASVSNYIKNANWEQLCKKYGVDFRTLSQPQKTELAILENAVGKSTGQSKVVAIPFAKAILDYSCSKKEDEIQGEKVYPFLIDSPFGDLSGENLRNSARELHLFSNQVILMISPDSYNMVKEHIEPYAMSIRKINKVPLKNQCVIGVD